jgi:AcrR family transcriptional regulator
MESGPTRADKRAATAARILEAAQVEFGSHGEDGATIRGIAARAGVDPSLVMQHYGSKQGLFALAVRPAADLTDEGIPAHLADVLELRLASLPPATRALMRSMLTSPEASTVMRDYLQERTENLAANMTGSDADLRGALAVSSIFGITIARHFLGLKALQDVDPEQLEAASNAWLAALTGSNEC